MKPVDLLRAVQWATQYLWFLPSDRTSHTQCASLLSKLAELQAVSKLSEGWQTSEFKDSDLAAQYRSNKDAGNDDSCSSMSSVQLCMRSVLDALWERLGSAPEAQPASALKGCLRSNDADNPVHPRLMQLCLPLLDQARLALQVSCFPISNKSDPSFWNVQRMGFPAHFKILHLTPSCLSHVLHSLSK